MRPIRLVVEGLRSFRAAAEIDFSGREHVAIIGDTGAGKSSLLEAMTWALYGCTSWSGKPNQELMNSTSTVVRVVLRFRVNNQTWEVTRVCRRSGDGTVGSAGTTLVRYGDSTDTIEQIEGARDVRARIVELIGLDEDAFMRAVILPQGQFAQLLVGDRDTERTRILRQVWRIEALQALREVARQAREVLTPTRAAVEQALQGEPEDPDRHLESLKATETKARAAEKSALNVHGSVRKARVAIDEARTVVECADEALSRLIFDSEALRSESETIQQKSKALRRARKAFEDEKSKAKAELLAQPSIDDGLSEAEVASARGTLNQVEEVARQLETVAKLVREEAVERKRAEEDVETAKAATTSARKAAEELRSAARELRRAHDGQVEYLKQCRDKLNHIRGETKSCETARSELADKTEVHRQCKEQLKREIAAADEAASAVRSTREKLDSAHREHSAAHAAIGLASGDACPVCLQDIPSDWTAPVAREIDLFLQAVTAAEATKHEHDKRVVDCGTALGVAENAADAMRERISLLESSIAGATDALSNLVGSKIDLGDHDDAILDSVVVAEKNARTLLEEREEGVRRADEEASQRATAEALTEQMAKNLQKQYTRSREDAESKAKLIASLIAELPKGVAFHLDVNDDVSAIVSIDCAPIAATRVSLDARSVVLREREKTKQVLRQKLDHLEERLEALSEEERTDVMKPTSALVDRLDAYRDTLQTAVTKLRIYGIELPSLVNVDSEELVVVIETLSQHTATVRTRAQDQRAISRAASDAAAEVIAKHGNALGAKEDDTPKQIEVLSQAECDNAAYASRTARDKANLFAARVDPLKSLINLRKDLLAKELAVSDLVAALNDGAFPKWLTLRRSRALLVHASHLLKEMTGQRYCFADLDDENSEWKVIDLDTGIPRSPASLSGGEKFVASLSLALGMVEMMARSGGRLESLWLDEGFAALDRSSLDAAIEALATAASGGRLVAVISHVRAVAEQVEDVLAVSRTSTGSTVRWLTASERLSAAETDEEDVRGAISGLLD